MIGLLQSARPGLAMLLCCGGLTLVAACSKPPQRPQRPPITVAVTPVRRLSVPYTIEANGVVTPMQTASVLPQVDGLVRRVAFQEGQEVHQGQILFEVDARPYQNAVNQAQASLERDQATAENAQAQYERYLPLAKQGYVTSEQVEQQRAAAASAKAVVQADSANLATAKFNLDNTTVRAPISGRTGSLLVRQGNLVRSGGGTPMVVIHQVRPILVRFAIPASQLPMILEYGAKGGLPVTAIPGTGVPLTNRSDSTASASPPSDGGDTPPRSAAIPVRSAGGAVPSMGALSFIDNAVDTTTGTVLLKATFQNPAGTLWVGQFVSTSLQLFVEQNALIIPAQCVVTGQRGTFVYVIDSTNTARQRMVAVERNTNGMSIIASGVSEGERVVTDGQSRLTPGAPVDLRTGRDSGGPASRGRGGRGGRGRGEAP
jgi:multidrug efflux system membrane fusion protein